MQAALAQISLPEFSMHSAETGIFYREGKGRTMRVAFISFHCRYHYQTIAGPFLQAAVSKSHPEFEWRTFEFLTSTPISNALSHILDYQPDVLAFSCYLWSIESQAQLAQRAKLVLPNAKLIAGGPECWLAMEQTNHPLLSAFDTIVIGEAEYEFPALLDRIQREVETEKIIRAKPIKELDELPSPYQMGLFRNDAPFLHMETSRGCVNHCTFCTSSHSSTRLYSIDRWRNDLKAVLDRFQNLQRINLLDRSLNEQTDRMVAVIDVFFEESNNQVLHIEMHPDFIDEDQLKYLASLPSGRLHVEMGIQSLDPETLQKVGRTSDPEHVCQIVETLTKLDSVSLHVDLISGLPAQKHKDIQSAVETLCSLQPDDIQLERLKLLPGTAIRRTATPSIIYAPTPPWEVLKTDDYSANELSESDRLSRLLDRYYNTAYLSRTLHRMALELGGYNVLWDLLGELNNGDNPTSVVERFRHLERIIEQNHLSNRVHEQWQFDLFLLGRYHFASHTASLPDYNHRLKAMTQVLPNKCKGHFERFKEPIEELPLFNSPGILLFLYQAEQVSIYHVDEPANPIRLTHLAISTKGKLRHIL